MPRQQLTLEEIIGLADEAAAVVAAVKSIVQAAKKAGADRVVDSGEIRAIETEVQKGIDALQKLGAEVVEQVTD